MRQESTQLKGQKFQGCPLGSVGNGRNSVTICGGEGKSGGAKSTDDESWSGQSSSAATSQQPRDEASSLSIATADVVQEMKKLLENEPQIAAQAAGVLVTSISRQGRAALLAALYSSGGDDESDAHFNEADTNSDGVVDRVEFAAYVEAQAVKQGTSSKPLTAQQLYQLGLRAGIGMIGFGFTDNAIMIIAGDAIQNSIGGVLGLTPLLSAGLGNAVADLVGTALRGYIEAASSKFMPEIRISAIQMTYKEASVADTVGSTVGVTVGCLLGLVPLFIIRPGSGPAPENAVASAESGAGSGSEPVTLCAEKQPTESALLDGSKTVFASVSSSSPSYLTTQHAGKMHHRLGGPVLILMISVLMAWRRLRDRSHSRQRPRCR